MAVNDRLEKVRAYRKQSNPFCFLAPSSLTLSLILLASSLFSRMHFFFGRKNNLQQVRDTNLTEIGSSHSIQNFRDAMPSENWTVVNRPSRRDIAYSQNRVL